MTDIADITGICDCCEDGRIVDFLVYVQFIAAGIARSMIVAEPLMIVLYGPYKVTFHDLHVIDIVEQPHVR